MLTRMISEGNLERMGRRGIVIGYWWEIKKK
jgi:hypothetical protein